MAQSALSFYDTEPVGGSLLAEVLAGLAARPRRLPPKLFYDPRGSWLFEAICETPEYYLARTEKGLLERHAAAIAAWAGPDTLLIEPGAGGCRKVRSLLPALRPRIYCPSDICRDQILTAARELRAEFPWLRVSAACADFTAAEVPAGPLEGGRRVIFFPGSTIGNFEPEEAVALLRGLARLAGEGGGLIIGVDLKKDPALLHAAYNDAAGFTAAFNRNLLARLNHELGADFRLSRFAHHAFYNRQAGRVEMHLVSRVAQRVSLAGERFEFAAGEGIHTENSYKYTVAQFQALAGRAGWLPQRVLADGDGVFSLQLMAVA